MPVKSTSKSSKPDTQTGQLIKTLWRYGCSENLQIDIKWASAKATNDTSHNEKRAKTKL